MPSFLHRLLDVIQQFAGHLGGPGLALIAFLDSSFLSFPEVGDLLIVALTIQHPAWWWYYGLLTTIGSVLGCYVIYALARAGGHAFLEKRFKAQHIQRGLAVFQRYGLLAVIVPSILPPPTPFKIFVLLAGVANIRPVTFVAAVAIGRGFRFVGEGWLAYRYGAQAQAFITTNLKMISIWIAGAVLLLGVVLIVRQRLTRPRQAS